MTTLSCGMFTFSHTSLLLLVDHAPLSMSLPLTLSPTSHLCLGSIKYSIKCSDT